MLGCGGNGAKDSASSNEADDKEETQKAHSTQELGVGPISKVELGEIDENLAEQGKETFKKYCSACHKFSKKYVGPAMSGVTERRTPEWIMNMILNPDGMLAENEYAQELLKEFVAPMANQNLKEEEARSILEYFRLKDSEEKL